jgi:hypothetical protein
MEEVFILHGVVKVTWTRPHQGARVWLRTFWANIQSKFWHDTGFS